MLSSGERGWGQHMLFVKELSTVVGGDIAVWRKIVERDEEIPEGEPEVEERATEIAARRIWKRYRRCIWWCENTNPMLPDLLGVGELANLHNLLDAIKRRVKQLSSEYVTKVLMFKAKPGEGKEFSASLVR